MILRDIGVESKGEKIPKFKVIRKKDPESISNKLKSWCGEEIDSNIYPGLDPLLWPSHQRNRT